MTRQEVHEILKTPFYQRSSKRLPILSWEHCAKKFYKIPNNLAFEHLMDMSDTACNKDDDPTILKCITANDAYYFGIGLSDCESISLKEVRELYNHAIWYVYTWSD